MRPIVGLSLVLIAAGCLVQLLSPAPLIGKVSCAQLDGSSNERLRFRRLVKLDDNKLLDELTEEEKGDADDLRGELRRRLGQQDREKERAGDLADGIWPEKPLGHIGRMAALNYEKELVVNGGDISLTPQASSSSSHVDVHTLYPDAKWSPPKRTYFHEEEEGEQQPSKRDQPEPYGGRLSGASRVGLVVDGDSNRRRRRRMCRRKRNKNHDVGLTSPAISVAEGGRAAYMTPALAV